MTYGSVQGSLRFVGFRIDDLRFRSRFLRLIGFRIDDLRFRSRFFKVCWL